MQQSNKIFEYNKSQGKIISTHWLYLYEQKNMRTY